MRFKLTDFYNETRGAGKIIVIDLGYLGDTIHLLPALCEIKRNYPQAELHVASAPVGSELLTMAPCVDRTWPLVRSPGGTPWSEQWSWIRAVRREHFQIAFNFSGTDRTVFLTFLTGARWRIAFAGGRDHFWNRWLIRHWIPRVDRTVPVAEQRRQVLAACGLSLALTQYELRIPPLAARWAQETIPPGAIHFSVNAGHALKEWPLDSWIALGRTILERDPTIRIIATGSRNAREQERVRQFAAAVEPQRVQIFPGNLELAQLAALLARCQMHVGADSGALHLAGILGIKTVSLFRQYAGLGEWLPQGPLHRSVIVPCGCVNQKVQPCARSNRPECLAGIPARQVLDLMLELGLDA